MKATSRIGKSTKIISGQPSWRVATDSVELFVTQMGGQVGPVTFDRRGRKLQPYSVAPWVTEPSARSLPPILRVLRGDFFCVPFGGNATAFRGEKHPIHGETANARWRFESLQSGGGLTCLHLSLRTKIRPGRVAKRIALREGENVIYSEHTLSGMSGPMNLGHHAMLRFPEEPGSGRISTSPFIHGHVFPQEFEQPEHGGYTSLKPGAEFKSLSKVPTKTGEPADLSCYPARRGFEDLVMIVSAANRGTGSSAGKSSGAFAWTAVAFPKQRYAWFALKDPQVLRETVFWLSNGGRHYPPWNGRHINVMGLEEVTSNFHFGLAESARQNPISRRGIPTCLRLNPKKPLAVRYMMGVTAIPAGFDRVATIERAGEDGILLRSASGRRAPVRVNVDFLWNGLQPG